MMVCGKFRKDFKILSLSSIIFCNLQNNFCCSKLSGKGEENDKKGSGNGDDKKKEETPYTPEEKQQKELEQFKSTVKSEFNQTIKIEKAKIITLDEAKKNNDTGSIFIDNTNMGVKTKDLQNDDQWFSYNSVFNFTDKLKQFINIVTKNNLEPSDKKNQIKLTIVYDTLIEETIDELKKHLNYNTDNVKTNIELVNQLNIEIAKGFQFKDFFQKYLYGAIFNNFASSNFNLIKDAKSVELYLDDILTSYYIAGCMKMSQVKPEYATDKNILFTDEAKVKIQEYRDKKPKFRLKNDVDIIYDSNEYKFCEFGPGLKNAGTIEDTNNEKQLKQDASIAKINYLNKVIKDLIGVDNAIDINKIKKEEDILVQLNQYSKNEVTPGTYRVLLKSRVSDNKNLGFIVLRDKTESPS